MKPDELKQEQIRLSGLIKEALTKTKEAMSSHYWSYTREYELGKLDVVKSILSATLDELEGGDVKMVVPQFGANDPKML